MMNISGLTRALRWMLVVAACLVPSLVAGSKAWAQTATPSPTSPSTPPAASTTPPAPAPAAPPVDTVKPGAQDTTGASPGDTSISQAMDVQPHPAVVISGSATWDTGFKTLTDAFATLTDSLNKNAMMPAGRPLAVFTSTDDNGFKYSAMIPIEKAPEGKTELSPDVKISETPSGKAIRFQHRASYDDIDSTYEAITAYLDEKGLEARNLFAEEYLKLTKTPDDPALEVDIYVFLK